MKFWPLGDMPAHNLIDNTTISCDSLLIFDAAQVAYISKLERLVSSKCNMIAWDAQTGYAISGVRPRISLFKRLLRLTNQCHFVDCALSFLWAVRCLVFRPPNFWGDMWVTRAQDDSLDCNKQSTTTNSPQLLVIRDSCWCFNIIGTAIEKWAHGNLLFLYMSMKH